MPARALRMVVVVGFAWLVSAGQAVAQKVAVYAAVSDFARAQDVQAKLAATGSFSQVDVFNIATCVVASRAIRTC